MRLLLLPVILVGLAIPVWDPFDDLQAPPAAPSARPCGGAEYRQFDFWVGEWEVTANGKVAGTNSVTRILGDCVIHEEWTGTGASRGRSFNVYDRATEQWVQTWVDNQGLLLSLRGGLVNGAMVLQGSRTAGDGKALVDRITWTPRADGSVRQHWQASTDAGATWQDQFDGSYRRRR